MNPQRRLPGDLLDVHIGAACDSLQPLLDDHGLGLQNVEVVPEKLHGQVGAHARYHFIDAHLNRLGDGDALAGQLPQFLFDQFRQLRRGMGSLPVLSRFERDKEVR